MEEIKKQENCVYIGRFRDNEYTKYYGESYFISGVKPEKVWFKDNTGKRYKDFWAGHTVHILHEKEFKNLFPNIKIKAGQIIKYKACKD